MLSFQVRGWVQEVFPTHNTMVCSMRLAGDSIHQQGAVEGHGDQPHASKPNRQSRRSLYSYRRSVCPAIIMATHEEVCGWSSKALSPGLSSSI